MPDALFAVDTEARTIRGLLLPFDEMSETSMNGVEPVMFSAATDLHLPADPIAAPLFAEDHDRFSGVGHATALERTDAGIVATFAIARTPEGDALLARAQQEPRPKLSAEVANLVRRGADAIKGAVTGASIVTKGAFASAGLFSAAGDVVEESTYTAAGADGSEYSSSTTTEETEEDLGDGRKRITRKTTTVTETLPPTDGQPVPTDSLVASAAGTHAAPAADSKEAPVPEATVPNTLLAGGAGAEPEKPNALSIRELDSMIHASRSGMFSILEIAKRLEGQNSTQDALFALNQVKFDGAGGLTPAVTAAPQWMGEIWLAAIAGFKQLVLPLYGHKDLTQMQLAGWKWTTQPSGGDFAGNGGAVPSNTLVVAAVTAAAARYAVGHSWAREFIDFPQPGLFESYAAAVTRDYLRWADNKVATAVVAGATVLAGDALATIPGNPAATATNPGGTIGNIMSAIIDGAAAIATNGILPDHALLNPADWKKLVKLPKNNVLGYLNAALGVADGSLDGFALRPAAAVTAGKVLVGVKDAVTVYELPGVPVRIDALNVAQGNADQAAFGYAGTVINDAAGLQLVTIATT